MKFSLRSLWRLLWRPLRAVLLGLATIVLLIEQWGWRPLTAWAERLARWKPLARLEALIRRASPRLALALFLVPALLLFPLKIAALWLIQEGQAALGVAVIIAAKLLGTAFVGRLFILLEPQLMTYPWFAKVLGRWQQTRDMLLARLRSSAVWRGARALRRTVRRWLHRTAG